MSSEPIPQERLDYLVDYVGQVVDAMHLNNWAVGMQDVYSEDDDSEAYVEIAWEKEYASLYISESFFDLDAEDKRQVIVHELVHLMIHPLDVHFCLVMNRRTDVDPIWKDRLETVVDNIARRIAPHVPVWQSGEEGDKVRSWRQKIATW